MMMNQAIRYADKDGGTIYIFSAGSSCVSELCKNTFRRQEML